MYHHIRIETADRVGTLTLHKANERNWLDYDTMLELNTALDALEADHSVKVILIRSGHPTFCAGVDPDYLYKLQQLSPQDNIGESLYLGSLLQRLQRHKRMVVMAVAGDALSEGAALCCCADFVVAADTAQFGFPDAKYGNIPAIAVYFALKKLHPGVTRRLFLGGKTHNAMAAREFGLVDEITTPEDLDTRAHALALELATGTSLGSVEFLKKLVADLPAMPHAEAMEFAAKINGHGRTNMEFIRGLQARHTGQEIQW